MPKNSLTILKDIYHSNLTNGLRIKYQGYIKEVYFGYDENVESYSFTYGSGKVMFQYVAIHNLITIIIFNDKNDAQHSYSKVISAKTYKEKKEKMEKVCQIFLDGVYDGCDINVVIPAIEKV